MRGWFFLFTLTVCSFSWATLPYPTHPVLEITPGSLCDQPTEFRYPEQIAYCERNVSTNRKYEIIDTYEKDYGYKILENDRQNFKIDHFIPLCMGGSNKADNLWPQHKSIYEVTDHYEQDLCEKLAHGETTQKQAIHTIRSTKLDMKAIW